jgi:hypothetical protein
MKTNVQCAKNAIMTGGYDKKNEKGQQEQN